jgi:anti-sigma factor RsiW
MTTEDKLSERDEVEMLLPWYVTGRLDAADKAKVDAFLAQDPAMRRQLDLIREEQSANIGTNEAIRAPQTLSVERGMQAVTAKTSLGARQTASSLFGRVREFFALPTARGVRYATVASAALVLMQAAVIGSLMSERSGYSTASGGGAAQGATAIVRFVDGATVANVTGTLERLGMSIVAGPKPGGTYVVRLGPASINKAERDAKITSLRQANGIVGLVLP